MHFGWNWFVISSIRTFRGIKKLSNLSENCFGGFVIYIYGFWNVIFITLIVFLDDESHLATRIYQRGAKGISSHDPSEFLRGWMDGSLVSPHPSRSCGWRSICASVRVSKEKKSKRRNFSFSSSFFRLIVRRSFQDDKNNNVCSGVPSAKCITKTHSRSLNAQQNPMAARVYIMAMYKSSLLML